MIYFSSRCTTLALGNGTACRETEQFISRLIQSDFFKPDNVQYTIINEAGTSIYSCTPEASAEFPGLDPKFISASTLKHISSLIIFFLNIFFHKFHWLGACKIQ